MIPKKYLSNLYLKTSRDRCSTASPGNLFQCLVRKFFLILNLPCYNSISLFLVLCPVGAEELIFIIFLTAPFVFKDCYQIPIQFCLHQIKYILPTFPHMLCISGLLWAFSNLFMFFLEGGALNGT